MDEKRDLFLIVDDEPDMCWALEHVLNKKGFLTKRVLNGRDAIALMERNLYKMVFLDAKLPDMEGLDLARQFRKIDPGVPIVMVSGYFYRDDEAVKRAISEGLISGFISKPFQNSEVVEVVEAV